MIQRFIYNNEAQSSSQYEIISQHPNVLKILDPKIVIKAKHREHIRIKIPKVLKPGPADVRVFICDKDEKIFDCILFRITFTN